MAIITPGSVYIPPRGNPHASVMVVGEAPGAHEERLGQPFVGPSGTLLDEMLSASGISPDDVFYTNICPYRPPNNEIQTFFSAEGLPNARVQEGLAHLVGQVNTVNPKVIVPLGNYPMAMLTGVARWSKKNGYTGIGDYRGSILRGGPLAGGRKCIPTYHPASILREYSNKPIVKLDLRRVAEQRAFPEIRRPVKGVVLDPRGAERLAWIQWLSSAPGTLSPPIHFTDGDTVSEWRQVPSSTFGSGDIEYISGKLLCLGVTRHRDVAIVLGVLNEADIREIRNLLESGIPWCFQNGMFDCSILEWHHDMKVTQHLRHDTMLMMHVAYTEFPKDLGFIGSVFTEQPNWKWMVDWDKVKTGEQTIQDVYAYNAIDTWVTQDAAEKMLEDELVPVANSLTYDFEVALIHPLWEMSRCGTRIDLPRLSSLKEKLSTEVHAMNWGLEQVYGGPVNVKSGQQLAKLLYDKLDVPRGKKTATKAWSFDDGTLGDLLLKAKTEQQKAVIKTIRGIRERRDLISKFCEIELDDDGRMRCHYDPAKTQTGRLSSRKFYPTGRGANLQNIPRDTRVRAVFIPDEGMVFGYADLKSAESLVVANITGDPEMLRLHSESFMTGEADGHRYVASYLFDKPMDQINKEERYIGKKVRHGCNYSMGWFRLMQVINAEAQETGVSINAATAKILIAKYRQLHPYLEVWWRNVESQLWKTKTILTTKKWIECDLLPHHTWSQTEMDAGGAWHQRPHIFFGRTDSILPEAIAQNPQGTIADTLNIGLLRASRDRELHELGYRSLLQVHDAIGFQAPRETIVPVCSRLAGLMAVKLRVDRKGTDPVDFTVPVDVKVGMNWGEYDPKKPEENPNGLVDIKDWMKREAA